MGDYMSKDNMDDFFEEHPTSRKTVYEGYIHKCPNCGEVLTAFTAVCPSCGYEIRDVRQAPAVREFSEKLQAISEEQMPTNNNISVMKKFLGRDFKNEEDDEEAREEFAEKKRERLVSLVDNFVVPNTREEMQAFLMLARDNLNSHSKDDNLYKAWFSKFQSVYRQAERSMGKQPEFSQIQSIYDEVMSSIEQEQKSSRQKIQKKWLTIIICIAALILLICAIANPVNTLKVIIIAIAIVVAGFVLFFRW